MVNRKEAQQEETRSKSNNNSFPNNMSQQLKHRRRGWRKRRGWRRRDKLDAIGWASVFIWSALVIMAFATGLIEDFNRWDGWGLFLVGVGSILIIATAIRWIVPEYRRPGRIWGLMFGLILLSIGLGGIVIWIWALLFGAIGVSILYRSFARGY